MLLTILVLRSLSVLILLPFLLVLLPDCDRCSKVVVQAFVLQRTVEYQQHHRSTRLPSSLRSSSSCYSCFTSSIDRNQYIHHYNDRINAMIKVRRRQQQQPLWVKVTAGVRHGFRLFTTSLKISPKKLLWPVILVMYSLLSWSRPVQASSILAGATKTSTASVLLSSPMLAQQLSEQSTQITALAEQPPLTPEQQAVSSSEWYDQTQEDEEMIMGLYIPSSLMTDPWTNHAGVSLADLEDDTLLNRDIVLVDRQTTPQKHLRQERNQQNQQHRDSAATNSPSSSSRRRTQHSLAQTKSEKESSAQNPALRELFHRASKSKQQQRQQKIFHKKGNSAGRGSRSGRRTQQTNDLWSPSPTRIVTGTGIVLLAAGAGVLMGQQVDPPSLGSTNYTTTNSNSNSNEIRSFPASFLQEPPRTVTLGDYDVNADGITRFEGNEGPFLQPMNSTTERANRLISDWVGLSRDITDRLRAIRQQEQDMATSRRQERRRDELDSLAALSSPVTMDEDDDEGAEQQQKNAAAIEQTRNVSVNEARRPLFFVRQLMPQPSQPPSSLFTKDWESSSTVQSIANPIPGDITIKDESGEVVPTIYTTINAFDDVSLPTNVQLQSFGIDSVPAPSPSTSSMEKQQPQPPQFQLLDEPPPPPKRKLVWLPSMEPKHIRARQQPKMTSEEQKLQLKYGSMPLRDRAYQILLDLGMIEDQGNSSTDDN